MHIPDDGSNAEVMAYSFGGLAASQFKGAVSAAKDRRRGGQTARQCLTLFAVLLNNENNLRLELKAENRHAGTG